MTVTVIRPGRLVQVEPDVLNADDVLDLAAALIRTHGWVQGESGEESRGWSIHGAIGDAARRVTRSGNKSNLAAIPFRDQAAAQIRALHDMTDIQLNDSCTTAEEAVQKMLDAKGVQVDGDDV